MPAHEIPFAQEQFRTWQMEEVGNKFRHRVRISTSNDFAAQCNAYYNNLRVQQYAEGIAAYEELCKIAKEDPVRAEMLYYGTADSLGTSNGYTEEMSRGEDRSALRREQEQLIRENIKKQCINNIAIILRAIISRSLDLALSLNDLIIIDNNGHNAQQRLNALVAFVQQQLLAIKDGFIIVQHLSENQRDRIKHEVAQALRGQTFDAREILGEFKKMGRDLEIYFEPFDIFSRVIDGAVSRIYKTSIEKIFANPHFQRLQKIRDYYKAGLWQKAREIANWGHPTESCIDW